MTSTTRRLGLPALLLAAAGCGSGPAASSAQGAMSVHLLTAPFDSLQDLQEVDLHILALEAHSNTTGWITLWEPKATFDLLSIDGVVETLASGVSLEPGKYTQFRLLLGPGQQDAGGEKISNLVVLQDGSAHDLTVPSGLQSGVKLVCQVDVQPGANTDVFISFEMPESIHLHGTGASAKYILRPVIHCFQGPGAEPLPPPGETGTITGKISGEFPGSETVVPIAGVTVTAQVLDAATGKASIVRSTTTVASADPLVSGTFTLDNLPLPATYYVVSQPVLGALAWEAEASLALPLDAAQPVRSWTAVFGSPVVTGSVAGTIVTATPNDADVVFVRQVLHPATPITVIVRTVGVQVSGSAETFTVDALPVNALVGTVYSLDATRPVLGGSVDVTVLAGPATPATLTFP